VGCSEIKLGLVRRLAATTIQSELLEAKVINGDEVDVSKLCTLASTVMRLTAALAAPTARGSGGRRTASLRCSALIRKVA